MGVGGGILGRFWDANRFYRWTSLRDWGTHTLFTSLEVAASHYYSAVEFARIIDPGLYRLLRHPLGSAFVLMVVYVPIV